MKRNKKTREVPANDKLGNQDGAVTDGVEVSPGLPPMCTQMPSPALQPASILSPVSSGADKPMNPRKCMGAPAKSSAALQGDC